METTFVFEPAIRENAEGFIKLNVPIRLGKGLLVNSFGVSTQMANDHTALAFHLRVLMTNEYQVELPEQITFVEVPGLLPGEYTMREELQGRG